MRLILGPVLLTAALPAIAQTTSSSRSEELSSVERSTAPVREGGYPSASGLSITVGVAPVLSPAWQGSKDVALSMFPDLRVAYGETFFASVPEGIGLNVFRRNGWRIGPLVKIRFGRDEDGRGSPFQIVGGSDALRGMGDVNPAGEAGVFLEKRFGSRERWRTRVETRQGFGGHDGMVADLSLSRAARTGSLAWSLGPRVTVASKDFIRRYFGIDEARARNTGLGLYRPGGGLVSIGLGGSAVRPIDRSSALTIFGGLDYLGDRPGHSPLIRERGRRAQATIGVGYGYRFGV